MASPTGSQAEPVSPTRFRPVEVSYTLGDTENPMTKTLGSLLRITFSVPLWLVIVIVAAMLILAIAFFPAQRETTKFIAVIVGASAAVYSAYYVGAGLRLRLDRDKRQASFEILSLPNRPEFAAIRGFLDKEVEGHDDLSEIDLYKKISEDPKLDDAVTVVLGILEDASIAIQEEYVDEDTLYLSVNQIVARNHEGLVGYINQLRKHRNNSAYYIEFEKLVTSWGKEKRRLSDGEPLPV